MAWSSRSQIWSPPGRFVLVRVEVVLSADDRWAPYLARFSRDPPNFLHAALDKTACAPFFKERRIRFAEPTNFSQEIGDVGYH